MILEDGYLQQKFMSIVASPEACEEIYSREGTKGTLGRYVHAGMENYTLLVLSSVLVEAPCAESWQSHPEL